jgi:hypothetical protein
MKYNSKFSTLNSQLSKSANAVSQSERFPRKSKILITGTAGFIGYHLATNLYTLNTIHSCDVNLKYARLKKLVK